MKIYFFSVCFFKRNVQHLMMLGLLVCFLSSYAQADTLSDRTKVRQQIEKLNQSIARDKGYADSLESEVERLERKLGDVASKKYKNEKKAERISQELEEKTKTFKRLTGELSQQENGLVQQLQALYTAGEQSHLRLLLKQDDPSDISRTIKYFEYLNKSRMGKIEDIQGIMTKVKSAEEKVKQDRSRLYTVEKQLLVQENELKELVAARTGALKKAEEIVASKKGRLKRLQTEEQRLQVKIDRLIAAEKRREKKRKEAAARKKRELAEKKRRKKIQQANKSRESNPSQKSTPQRKAPAKKKVASGKPVGNVQRFTPNKPFASLRGKMAWPVKGRIRASYGSRRNEKQRWKGVLIAAPVGSHVKAIADGVVEYANWFKGYGYLVIVRHDRRYRSLYGYNRAIHVRENAKVRAGTVIASVGNSGGQRENALYFEIRRGKKPQNPKRWCR